MIGTAGSDKHGALETTANRDQIYAERAAVCTGMGGTSKPHILAL